MTQTRSQTKTAGVGTVNRSARTVADVAATSRVGTRRWQAGTVNPFDPRVYRDFFTADWN